MARKELDTSFATALGFFHTAWVTFELAVEAAANKVTKLSPRHHNIIFCSLNMQAKIEITIALLRESKLKNYEDIISIIHATSQTASRNHLIHSIFLLHGTYDRESHVLFRKRDIKTPRKVMS